MYYITYYSEKAMLKIKNLTHYTDENTHEKRTEFIYIIGDNGYFEKIDVANHVTLEMALSIVKDMMAERLIHISLKETISKIDAADEDFEFMGLDIREMIFDIDIFDKTSELYQTFKRLIVKYWSRDFPLVYYLFLNIEDIKIHDDSDGKMLYDHYFEGLKEFKNKISFIEYINSRVRLPVVNDYLAYIDTDKLVDYYIIDPTVRRADLDYVLRQNRIHIKFTKDNASHWQAFGYCYAKDNDLSDLEALSFAKLMSRYISGTEESLNKNKYIKEYLIEEEINKRNAELVSQELPADERIEKIFYELFDIYESRIADYEYRNKQLNFRITSRKHDEFMRVPGKTNTEKLENLIDFYIENTSRNSIDFTSWMGDVKVINSTKNIHDSNE